VVIAVHILQGKLGGDEGVDRRRGARIPDRGLDARGGLIVRAVKLGIRRRDSSRAAQFTSVDRITAFILTSPRLPVIQRWLLFLSQERNVLPAGHSSPMFGAGILERLRVSEQITRRRRKHPRRQDHPLAADTGPTGRDGLPRMRRGAGHPAGG